MMTSRGASQLGGDKAVINPFMDNGNVKRISISIDNSYNRGKIPAFSLWAPSDKTSNPWKYMPYIPAITIRTATSTTSLDIDNRWVDYFRAGDEIIVYDTSTAASNNLAFNGQSGTDLSTVTLGTDTCTISAVGAKDSGAGGTGYVLITLADALSTGATGGAEGTGDIIVLAAPSTTSGADIEAYQEADTVVIMEQEFDFQDSITGVIGEGGYLTESAVYSYDGRIDTRYIQYYSALNTFDATPGLTLCGKFTNYTRFNFESIYRG
jgi:hypothetical protein